MQLGVSQRDAVWIPLKAFIEKSAKEWKGPDYCKANWEKSLGEFFWSLLHDWRQKSAGWPLPAPPSR